MISTTFSRDNIPLDLFLKFKPVGLRRHVVRERTLFSIEILECFIIRTKISLMEVSDSYDQHVRPAAPRGRWRYVYPVVTIIVLWIIIGGILLALNDTV